MVLIDKYKKFNLAVQGDITKLLILRSFLVIKYMFRERQGFAYHVKGLFHHAS